MSALTRYDPIAPMFPDLFRRFALPMRLAEETPGEIRGSSSKIIEIQ